MDLKRVGACTLGLRMLGPDAALDELVSLGLTGVDIWQVSPYYENKGHVASDCSAEERRRLKEAVSERGLRLDHLASYPGAAFNADEPSAREKDLAWTKETVDLCVDLGIPVMRIGTGRGENLDHLPVVAPLLRQAADYAAVKGIRLNMETHHGMPACRADWIQQILDAVGSDNLGVLYDPGNLAPGEAYREIPRQLADRIFHVHLKNIHLADDGRTATGWAAPAEGAVDMGWVLQALDDCGYDGPVSIEYEAFRENATLEDARNGLRQWLEFLGGH